MQIKAPFVSRLSVLTAIAGIFAAAPVLAQQPEQGKAFRKLAPGVETTIPADVQPEETVSVHDLVELRKIPDLKWKPNYTPESRTLYEKSGGVPFRRTIACLEFTFKPMRMIYVDIPQPSGKMQRKLIWYIVYRVKNVGGHIEPEKQEDDSYAMKKVATPVFFQPSFLLQGYDVDKTYLDRIIPVAIGPIEQREDPNRRLLNSVQMSQTPIEVSTDRVDRSVWGVATWEDVDPRIDFFSVFVQGLTNAYRWADPDGAYQHGDPPGKGRTFQRKTLQLNFWRPGDEHLQHEEEFHFGLPKGKAAIYGVQDGVDYRWVYR